MSQEIEIDSIDLHRVSFDPNINKYISTKSQATIYTNSSNTNVNTVDNIDISFVKDSFIKLHKQFHLGRKSITYSKYNDGSDFKDQLDTQNYNSLSITQTLTDKLINHLIGNAIGGYLLFSKYSVNGNTFFSVYLIRQVDGMNTQFCSIQNRYILEHIKMLDTDHLAMAARINLTEYNNGNDESYISFIKGNRSNEITKYFFQWLGADHSQDETKNGKNFRKLITELPLAKIVPSSEYTEQDGITINRVKFINSVFDYVQKEGKIIIANISNKFCNDSDVISDFMATDSKYRVDSDIELTDKVKKFMKVINLKSQQSNISLSFTTDDIGSKIFEDNGIVTINDPELAKQVKELNN